MSKVDWNQKDQGTSSGFDPVPKGRYLAVVDDTETKETRNKNGSYIEIEFEVVKGVEGDRFKRRKLWARLNVHNPSEVAQRIGREEFNSLCLAVGKPEVGDTTELHGKLVVLIVDIEEQQGQPPQNRVTGFLAPAAGEKAPTPTPKPGARQAPPPVAAKKPKKKPKSGERLEELDDDIPF